MQNFTIFLSYCWKDLEIVNIIEEDLRSMKIDFIRDISHINYKDSIKEFMHKIAKTDFVLMIISNEYLISENCMYEVNELLNTHEFEKRILPILLPNAKIFSIKERSIYYDHWENEKEKANANISIDKYKNVDYITYLNKCKDICRFLGDFFHIIKDLKMITFENLKKENYKSLLKILFPQKDTVKTVNQFISEHKIKEAIDLLRIIDRESAFSKEINIVLDNYNELVNSLKSNKISDNEFKKQMDEIKVRIMKIVDKL